MSQPKDAYQFILQGSQWVPWSGTAGAANVVIVDSAGEPVSYPTGTADDETTTVLLGVAGMQYVFDGTNWDRVRGFAADADNVAAPTVGLAGSASFLFAFDGTTFDRIRTITTGSDNIATSAGAMLSAAFSYGFDGVTWDRLVCANSSADGTSTETSGVQKVQALGYVFNGATFDRRRSQDATNAALAQQIGVALSAPPANWSITHTPAADTQATITRAAGGAGVVHICTSITATLIAPAGSVSGNVQINLRDGASGLGTILWSQTFLVGGATSVSAGVIGIALSGLQIPGSPNTAMTLEFSAAGGANTLESVALTGYDVA